jgi:hypothetical protein
MLERLAAGAVEGPLRDFCVAIQLESFQKWCNPPSERKDEAAKAALIRRHLRHG